MPCLAGTISLAGMLVQVPIFRDKDHVLQFSTITTGSTPPSLAMYAALIDTGASATCISPKVVSDLGLMPIGKADMISASHVTVTNKYIFTVGFIVGAAQQPSGNIQGQIFSFENIAGLEFKPAGSVYDVLIGMDIIGKGVLTVKFCGTIYFLILT
jgi:hypothetical protein